MSAMDPEIDVARLRREYRRATLEPDGLDPQPHVQVARWLAEAAAAGIAEPNAMTLATADADGVPSARTVLLRGIDVRGLAFFTNYASRKARELDANPRAAVVLAWVPLERQVCVAGTVSRTTEEESDAYFASRPLGSRLGAWASEQSAVIPHRGVLEAARDAAAARVVDGEIPRPSFWGGYRLAPERVELWQGRPDRLHDRLQYRRTAGGWVVERLSP